MRRLSAALAASAFAAFGLAAQAGTVPLDHAIRLNLSGPAAEVVIGSPKYVDVTVVDPRTVLVHGKELGVTNLIIYDAAGRAVFNDRLSVVAPAGAEVSIIRGSEPVEFVCGGGCRNTRPAPRNPWMDLAEAVQSVRDRSAASAPTAAASTDAKP